MSPPGTFNIGDRLLVADFDGDGDHDLVLMTGLYRNDGNGELTLVNLPHPANAIAHAAFDGDGILDLVGRSEIWRGTGNLQFVAGAVLIAGNTTIRQAYVLDLDSDGDSDLLVQTWAGTTPSIWSAWINNGAAQFTPAAPGAYGLPTSAPASLVTGDFNGDGRTDVMIAMSGVFFPGGGHLDGDVDLWVLHNGWYAVAVNDGHNQFAIDASRVSTDRAEHAAVDLAVLDVDRDGDHDALIIARDPHTQFHHQAVLSNHLPQLRPLTMARPGGGLETELSAVRATPAPIAAVFAVSTVAAAVPIGDLGRLGVDPSQSVLWMASFGSETASGSLPIPLLAGLRGLRLHAQALLAAPTSLRPSNTIRSVILDWRVAAAPRAPAAGASTGTAGNRRLAVPRR